MSTLTITLENIEQAPSVDYRRQHRLKVKFITSMAPYKREIFGRRLVKLAAYIESLPDSLYAHERLVTTVKPCGAVACAFGHAVVSKKFPAINVKNDP